MIINQTNLRSLDISFSAAFNKQFESVKTDYQKIATTVQSSTAETDYDWLGQIPQMREWIGEREIQNLNAYHYAIRNRKFEMTVSVPRDKIEDDQYGVYSARFAQMGESAARHPEELVFEALKNGFSQKCFDGKAFFAADHPSGENGKSTASNKSTYKLSADTYEAARSAMMGLTGDKGKPLGIVPNLLVVSASNERAARLILKADQIGGTSNVLKDTAELMVTPMLADHPDYWFLLSTDRFLKPLIFQERKKIKLVSKTRNEDDNVFMHDEFLWGADGRSNAGYGFWQMAFGSTGEEAAPVG